MGKTARSGDLVLRTRNLAVGYDDAPAPLFYAPDITLRRGEVAALIGANGAGKSTFVKTIIEQIEPLDGEILLGAAVQVGYFAQAHELLDPRNTLIDEITTVKEMPLSQARDFLASFLFTGDDVFRTIDTLSGGERGRVALAKLALTGANLLLLDEPTNHLDIPSQEILQNVLADFPGTILLVSHDRYLIDALATQIWALSFADDGDAPADLEVFEGTYQEFLAAREARRQALIAEREHQRESAAAANKQTASKRTNGMNPRQLQARITELEALIPQLEARLAELSDLITEASGRGDSARVRELGEAYTQTESDLMTILSEWEMLLET
jgi:ATP-binding cassette subfamily F protein 3